MMSDQGWGTTSYGGSSSSVLLEVEIPVVTNEQCKTAMAYIEDYYVVYDYDMDDLITDGMLCAGGVEGEDNCYVSAGHCQLQCSPLSLVEVQRGWALIGREDHSVATSAILCQK